jgi:hypothetical protein
MDKKRNLYTILFCLLAVLHWSCRPGEKAVEEKVVYQDSSFWQEYHEAYPISGNPDENQVRSLAVDPQSTVWAATANGVFYKKKRSAQLGGRYDRGR